MHSDRGLRWLCNVGGTCKESERLVSVTVSQHGVQALVRQCSQAIFCSCSAKYEWCQHESETYAYCKIF
jgi:hypothetical protein